MVRYIFRSKDFPHNHIYQLTIEQKINILRGMCELMKPSGAVIDMRYLEIAERYFATVLWFRVGDLVMHSADYNFESNSNGDIIGYGSHKTIQHLRAC